jgi:hypothetical protein
MSKFMVLYRSPNSPAEMMANATPEELQAGLAAWQTWAGKVQYALADLGAPVVHTTHVGAGEKGSGDVCGFSILDAGSADEVHTILDGHPHLAQPGNSVEVFEFLPMGDMG